MIIDRPPAKRSDGFFLTVVWDSSSVVDTIDLSHCRDFVRRNPLETPTVFLHTLPGGSCPERMTKGAIGYDVRIRALVSPTDMDPIHSALRKTIFDFHEIPDDPRVAGQVFELTKRSGERELVYRLQPGESVLASIGFVTEMPFPLFYWVAPRSGLASKWHITVTNAPGTVDPDYRGEAGVLVPQPRPEPLRSPPRYADRANHLPIRHRSDARPDLALRRPHTNRPERGRFRLDRRPVTPRLLRGFFIEQNGPKMDLGRTSTQPFAKGWFDNTFVRKTHPDVVPLLFSPWKGSRAGFRPFLGECPPVIRPGETRRRRAPEGARSRIGISLERR